MKTRVGTDIVEISRIKENIEKYGNTFLKKIYTEKEIAYCEAKKLNKYESYAGRFAAKEAIYKAINTEINKTIEWKDIEIINRPNGKPIVNLNIESTNIDNIDISISHSKQDAIAFAIVIFREK